MWHETYIEVQKWWMMMLKLQTGEKQVKKGAKMSKLGFLCGTMCMQERPCVLWICTHTERGSYACIN